MNAVITKIGPKKLAALAVAVVAAIVDQLTGTNLLSTVLPALVGL